LYLIFFIVTAFPTFTTPLKTKTEALLMDNVRFTCKGMGEPTLSYVWSYSNYTNGSGKLLLIFVIYYCWYIVAIHFNPVDGTHIQIGINNETDVSFLMINEVTMADDGNYTCQITTPAGTEESTSSLEVSVRGS